MMLCCSSSERGSSQRSSSSSSSCRVSREGGEGRGARLATSGMAGEEVDGEAGRRAPSVWLCAATFCFSISLSVSIRFHASPFALGSVPVSQRIHVMKDVRSSLEYSEPCCQAATSVRPRARPGPRLRLRARHWCGSAHPRQVAGCCLLWGGGC